MKLNYLLFSVIIGALGSFGTLSHAGDNTAGAKDPRCIPMSQIQRIEVLDDQTLRFHMSAGQDYINSLPSKCSGLKDNTLLHKTSTNDYCDLDTISVVDANLGAKLGTCALGKFSPYIENEKARPAASAGEKKKM